jgi:hypothetical protein
MIFKLVLFYVGSGHLKEMLHQNLWIFHIGIFYNDLFNYKASFIHKCKSIQEINVWDLPQVTDHHRDSCKFSYFSKEQIIHNNLSKFWLLWILYKRICCKRQIAKGYCVILFMRILANGVLATGAGVAPMLCLREERRLEPPSPLEAM